MYVLFKLRMIDLNDNSWMKNGIKRRRLEPNTDLEIKVEEYKNRIRVLEMENKDLRLQISVNYENLATENQILRRQIVELNNKINDSTAVGFVCEIPYNKRDANIQQRVKSCKEVRGDRSSFDNVKKTPINGSRFTTKANCTESCNF